MSCKFSDNEGKCKFNGDGIERPIDKDGLCTCDEDPNPEDQCEDYQEK